MAKSKSNKRPSQRPRRRCQPVEDEATTESPKVWPEKLIGAKYVRLLEKQLQQLHDEDAHGNRRLFLDDVFVAYLLAFYNPTIRSLRTIEDLSQTQQAQKLISVDKICKSTLSDFNRLVDPERLVPIIETLRGQLSRKHASSACPHGLTELLKHTVAVDGTFLHAVANVAWAVANSNNHGATRHRARLDARINVSTWLPEAIVVPDPGESEADSAIKHLQGGCIYLYDRGYPSFALLRAHYATTTGSGQEPAGIKSHFVMRYKKAGGNSPSLSEATQRPLTEEDRAAGVLSDRVGYFTSDSAQREGIATIQLREVIVPYEENGEPKTLRLITNLLDVSAHTIVLLYQYRWQVEIVQSYYLHRSRVRFDIFKYRRSPAWIASICGVRVGFGGDQFARIGVGPTARVIAKLLQAMQFLGIGVDCPAACRQDFV